MMGGGGGGEGGVRSVTNKLLVTKLVVCKQFNAYFHLDIRTSYRYKEILALTNWLIHFDFFERDASPAVDREHVSCRPFCFYSQASILARSTGAWKNRIPNKSAGIRDGLFLFP